jgi:hypothetical protein
MKKLRVIVRQTDITAAVNVGGPIATSHKTFVVDAPELVDHLHQPSREAWGYTAREVIGYELIDVEEPPS